MAPVIWIELAAMVGLITLFYITPPRLYGSKDGRVSTMISGTIAVIAIGVSWLLHDLFG